MYVSTQEITPTVKTGSALLPPKVSLWPLSLLLTPPTPQPAFLTLPLVGEVELIELPRISLSLCFLRSSKKEAQ